MNDHLLTISTGTVLLGGDNQEHAKDDWQDLPPHHDEGQVQLDVHRAFVHYPTGMFA